MKLFGFLRNLLRKTSRETVPSPVSSETISPAQIEDITSESEGVLSPEGMKITASVGQRRQRETFFESTATMEEVGESSLTFTKCGHRGAKEAKGTLYGQVLHREISDETIKRVEGLMTVDDLCLRCDFEEMKRFSIRCCLCGYGIKPGDPVALYHKSSKGFNESTTTFVGDSAVGCLLWDCCPSGGFFVGHWSTKGVKSAFSGGRTAVEEAFSKPGIVVSNP